MGVIWMAVWKPEKKSYDTFPLEGVSDSSQQELIEQAMLRTTYADSKVILYCLKGSLDWNKKESHLREIPGEQEELAAVSTRLTGNNVRKLVFEASLDREVTVVAWVTSVTDEFLQQVEESENKYIFDAVTLDIGNYGSFQEEDVTINMNGEKITDYEITAEEDRHPVEVFLREPRIYTDKQAVEDSAEYYVKELTRQMSRSRERLNKIFTTKPGDRRHHIREPSEFETVAAVRTASKGAEHDVEALENVRCSDHVSAAFTATYTQPTLRPLTGHKKGKVSFVYRQGTSWDLSLYLRYKHVPEVENAVEKEEYAKYSPKSDFRLDNEYGIPILLGEIVSDPDKESDRYRLLLHLIAIIKLASCLFQDFALMGVYVNKKYISSRYIVHMKGGKVKICREDFDLTEQCRGREFMLQILNYGSYVEALEADIDVGLAEAIRGGIESIVRGGNFFPSLTSKSKSSKKAAGAGKSTARSQGTPLQTIAENTSGGNSSG